METETIIAAVGGLALGWAMGFLGSRKKTPVATAEDIITALLRMDRREREALRQAMERRLGPASSEADASPAAVPDEPGAPTMDLILVDAGTERIAVIRELRQLTGLGLAEAKTLSETSGSVVLSGSKARVDAAREALESAGALTEVRRRS